MALDSIENAYVKLGVERRSSTQMVPVPTAAQAQATPDFTHRRKAIWEQPPAGLELRARGL